MDDEGFILGEVLALGVGAEDGQPLAIEISMSKHKPKAEKMSAWRWRPCSDRAVDTRSSA